MTDQSSSPADAGTVAQQLRNALLALPVGPWSVEDERLGHPDEARIYDGHQKGVCKLTTGDGPGVLRARAEQLVRLHRLSEQAVLLLASPREDGIRYDAESNTYVARHTILTAGRTEDEAKRALASAVTMTAKHWPALSGLPVAPAGLSDDLIAKVMANRGTPPDVQAWANQLAADSAAAGEIEYRAPISVEAREQAIRMAKRSGIAVGVNSAQEQRDEAKARALLNLPPNHGI